jgi:hypothetical protein
VAHSLTTFRSKTNIPGESNLPTAYGSPPHSSLGTSVICLTPIGSILRLLCLQVAASSWVMSSRPQTTAPAEVRLCSATPRHGWLRTHRQKWAEAESLGAWSMAEGNVLCQPSTP